MLDFPLPHPKDQQESVIRKFLHRRRVKTSKNVPPTHPPSPQAGSLQSKVQSGLAFYQSVTFSSSCFLLGCTVVVMLLEEKMQPVKRSWCTLLGSDPCWDALMITSGAGNCIQPTSYGCSPRCTLELTTAATFNQFRSILSWLSSRTKTILWINVIVFHHSMNMQMPTSSCSSPSKLNSQLCVAVLLPLSRATLDWRRIRFSVLYWMHNQCTIIMQCFDMQCMKIYSNDVNCWMYDTLE